MDKVILAIFRLLAEDSHSAINYNGCVETITWDSAQNC